MPWQALECNSSSRSRVRIVEYTPLLPWGSSTVLMYQLLHSPWCEPLHVSPLNESLASICAWVRGRRMSHCTCTCTVFDKDRLNGAPIVRGCLNVGVHTVLYLYSVRHGQPEMCLLYVRPCAWTCTLYVYVCSVWHGHLSDAPIVRKPVCLGVHTVRVRVQCLA